MGFLDRLKASQSVANIGWKSLENIAQLEEIDLLSASKPVVIFKHSTTCGISAGAKHRIETGYEDIADQCKFYYLDLLSHRPVSNAVADHYQIRHESPQTLVVKDGKVVHHSSHQRVSAQDLANHLS